MNELFDFVRIEDGPGPNSFTASLYWDKEKREYFTRSSSLEHDRILALGTLYRKYGGEIIRHIVETNTSRTDPERDNSSEMVAMTWGMANANNACISGLQRQVQILMNEIFCTHTNRPATRNQTLLGEVRELRRIIFSLQGEGSKEQEV